MKTNNNIPSQRKDDFDLMVAGMSMSMNKTKTIAWHKFYMSVDNFELFLECFEFDAKERDYKYAILPVVRNRYNSLSKAKTITTVTSDFDIHDELSALIKDCAVMVQQIAVIEAKTGKWDEYRQMAAGIFKHSLFKKKQRIEELREIGAEPELSKNPNYLCSRCRNHGWLHIAIGGTSPHNCKPINHVKHKSGTTFSYITQKFIPCVCKKGLKILDNAKNFNFSNESHRHLVLEYVFKNESTAIKFIRDNKRKEIENAK